jgi:hypothetical protein
MVGHVDAKRTAEMLVREVAGLPKNQRNELRNATELTATETSELRDAFLGDAVTHGRFANAILERWLELTEAERVASLLLFREMLSATG